MTSKAGEKLPVAVLISGRGSNLKALIDAAANPEFPARIVLVLSNRLDAGGLAHADAAGIETVIVEHRAFTGREAFERMVDARLDAAGARLICLAGFMRLLTPWFVGRWQGRMINIHPSLLPAFPGLDTHARALAAGVRFHGCTVHFVTAEMDAGPIIAQAVVPVASGDTADVLAARVLEAEHRLYPMAVRLIAEGRVEIDGDLARVDGPAPAGAVINPDVAAG